MIHLKTIECNPQGCGTMFTVEPKLNDSAHEHLEFCMEKGYEYKEGIIKKDGDDLVVCCPKCGKEAIRKVRGWIDGLN